MNSETNNTSGLHPLGRAVLVMPYQPEIKKGLIVLTETIQDRQNMVDQRVRVIEVGPACWPDEAPRASPGDYVLISKMSGWYAGKDMTKDGKNYIVVNDRDIFCGIEEDNHE